MKKKIENLPLLAEACANEAVLFKLATIDEWQVCGASLAARYVLNEAHSGQIVRPRILSLSRLNCSRGRSAA